MASLQRYAGGSAGVGLPIAARQFLDEPGQPRYAQPSALLGLGTGVAAGGLYLTDLVDVPVVNDEFLAAHAITSTPLGAFYAAFPKRSGTSTTEQVRETLLGAGQQPRRQSGSGTQAQSGSTTVESRSGRRSAGSR